ncbi:MAG: hypothetical protein D6784_14565 [Chloroflexi bacterium]|nr:MAG: hypothetical protein D6784_14565 [Chloroflexota bacterium]
MTPQELADILRHLPPANVPAVRFYLALQENRENVQWLIENKPFIQAALADLEQQIQHARRITYRCKGLRPTPARIPPPGL